MDYIVSKVGNLDLLEKDPNSGEGCISKPANVLLAPIMTDSGTTYRVIKYIKIPIAIVVSVCKACISKSSQIAALSRAKRLEKRMLKFRLPS